MAYTASELRAWGESELIEELLVQQRLLKEAHEVLVNYWFSEVDDSYNNDDVIDIDHKITKHLEGGK